MSLGVGSKDDTKLEIQLPPALLGRQEAWVPQRSEGGSSRVLKAAVPPGLPSGGLWRVREPEG